MAITITGTLIIDETSGKQNNDVADGLGFINTGVSAFDTLLQNVVVQNLNGVNVTVSVSNGTSADLDGSPMLSGFGADVTDLAFTNSTGGPLLGELALSAPGVPLLTVDGRQIYLYSYTGADLGIDENNAVFGRKANADGTANATGDVVFAAYLQPTNASGAVQASDLNAVGSKVWLVQYEEIKHPITTDPDDGLSLYNLHVSVSNRSDFSLEGAPSGQNLFLMYGDGTPSPTDAVIIVTGKDPINQSEPNAPAITAGDTVNTGQGGGPTTLGTNSQQIVEGTGLYFTFAQGANPDYTVNADHSATSVGFLDQNEADVEANIDFTSLYGTNGASFSVVQSSSGDKSTLKISAYTAPENKTGVDFIDNLHNNTAVDVNKVTITTQPTGHGKNAVPGETLVFDKVVIGTTATTLSGITVTFSNDKTVEIKGLEANDLIAYNTAVPHNRVLIDNIGSTDTNFDAPFDIGGFSLINSAVTPNLFSELTFQDDGPTATGTPVTATVDEDGLLPGGIDGGPGDVGLLVPATVSGNIASIFQAGADAPATYGLSTDTSNLLQTLTSKGGAVVYNVTGNTLTAYVEVSGAGYNAAVDRTVFTFALTATTGAYTFTQLDQLDHPSLNGQTGDNTENDLVLQLGTILQATDKDGDTVTAAAEKLEITVDDDTPVVRSITNLVGFNTPLTGRYDFGIGADDTGNAAVDGVVLNASGLTGTTSGGRAITDAVVTHQSENDNSVTYAFAFNYFTSSAPSTAQLPASGTVTFNKLDGTFVFDLAAPILGSTTFSTSDIAGLIKYDTTGSNSPEITVKEYNADFVGVLYAQSTDGGKDVILDMKAGGDYTFTAGETFTSQVPAYINVSTVTLGANSDTLQPYEVLNFDFFVDNPVVPASPTSPPQQSGAAIDFTTGKALVDTVAITLNQININGQDDVAILLKLRKISDGTLTTSLLIANSATDYVAVAGTQNHVVTVGTDDYDAANYKIYGVQVLASTENVSGTAVRLSDHSAVTLTSGNGTYADTSDNDVLKIVKIDVSISRPADADLQFTGVVVDADGDSTPNFNFSVHLESDSQVLTGSAGSDYLNGTSAADTMSGGAGADFMTGGAGADQFVFAAGDSGITLATADTITDFVTGVDTIATSKLAGNATIADGSALVDFAAFVTAANAMLTAGAGTNDVYVAYNAAASDNAWAVVDENDSGSVDAGDTVIVLVGVNLASEVAPGDFV